MDEIPDAVKQRLERAAGAPVDLWVEPDAPGGVRVTVVFLTRNEPPLAVTVLRLFEAQWPFGATPTLRLAWRMSSVAKSVRLSTVKSFDLPGSDPAVRVEVDLEGSASMAFEGAQLTMGPVPPAKPESEPMMSPLSGFEA